MLCLLLSSAARFTMASTPNLRVSLLQGGESRMRTAMNSFCAATVLFTCLGASAGSPPSKPQHPSNVALVHVAETDTWFYVHFPSNLRLYFFDGDLKGKSNCNAGCDSAWPPLLVPAEDSGPVGDWTFITRNDGRRQWTYKGRPVYLRYHDTPENPLGDGRDGAWHFLIP